MGNTIFSKELEKIIRMKINYPSEFVVNEDRGREI